MSTPQEQLSILLELFPDLTEEQRRQFAQLDALYREWNAKINLISRRDIDNLYMRHVLHSLGITRLIHYFVPGTQVIDVGTGGGFPGIPLAILMPHCQFSLVDSIGKKVCVAADIARQLGLDNVCTYHARIEELKIKGHFVVSRAAMAMRELEKACRKCFLSEQLNALPNGIIALKGGNLKGELATYQNRVIVESLANFALDDYFQEKCVVYLPQP